MIARSVGAAPPLLALLAALVLPALVHRSHRMATTPHQPATPPHQAIITAALEDYWMTSDPRAPFHIPAAAEQIELYLNSSGYQITPDTTTHRMRTPTPTSRAHVAGVLLLTVICLALTIAATVTEHWALALPAFIGTVLLSWATADAYTEHRADRRHGRNAR